VWAHWADGVIEGMSGVCSRTGPAGTTTYVSSYYYICVLIPRCVLILLHMCTSYYYTCSAPAPRPGTLANSRELVFRETFRCSMSNPHTAIYASSYCYICVLILLCVCPHTIIYVSSCYYVSALSRRAPAALASRELVFRCYTCPHTAIYVSSY
jgi:hypothetical protein